MDSPLPLKKRKLECVGGGVGGGVGGVGDGVMPQRRTLKMERAKLEAQSEETEKRFNVKKKQHVNNR